MYTLVEEIMVTFLYFLKFISFFFNVCKLLQLFQSALLHESLANLNGTTYDLYSGNYILLKKKEVLERLLCNNKTRI